MMTPEEFTSEWLNDAPYVEVNTSGSTGKPKRIKLSKELMVASARRTIDFFGLTSESRLHSCLSADYIAGKMMIVRGAVCGADVTFETPSNRPLSQIATSERIDLLSVVPSQMIHILDHQDKLPEICNILVGGSAIPYSLRRRIAASELNVFESYGMTETASHIALRRVGMDAEEPFTLLPDVGIDLDVRGCLTVHMKGYPPLITNDVAELHGNGFIIRGRADNVIISGGKKIHPEVVERKIEALMNGLNYFIHSRSDEKWGERVLLVIEGNDPLPPGLKSALRAVTLPEEYPEDIVRLGHFKRTPTGKLIRQI